MSSRTPVDGYVGSRIKTRRTEMGLTQNKIAEMIGVTFQQIQKYENGQNRIGSSRLYEIAKILRVPVAYFFEGLKSSTSSSSDANAVFSDNKEEFQHIDEVKEKDIMFLIKHFSKIKDENLRKSVINLAKTLAKQEEDK